MLWKCFYSVCILSQLLKLLEQKKCAAWRHELWNLGFSETILLSILLNCFTGAIKNVVD